MKQINTEILKALKPCADRYKVWLENYVDFDGSLVDFLELDKISAKDKIWVSVRVMPKFLVEVFAIDCAFSAASALAAGAAANYAAAYDAGYAYYATYYADYADFAAVAATAGADFATAGAAGAAERENQIDALIMLIKSEGEL